MNKYLVLCMMLLLAGCGSSSSHRDEPEDDPYTQEDLDKETEGVYRPKNSGTDDDGVEKGSREKPVREEVEKPREEPSKPPKEEPKKEPPKKGPGPTVEKPKEEPKKEPPKAEPKKEEPKKVDRTELMAVFIGDVSRRMDALEETKLWKDFLKAKEKFDDRVDKGMEKKNNDNGKDTEAAWANAIVAWYEVRYMYELLLHVNWKASREFEPGAGLTFTELESYSDTELKSADCAQAKAAFELAEPEMKEVRQFQTDVLKYDLVASKVYVDPKQQKKWLAEKQKWQDATEGKFDAADVKKYR